MAELNRLWLIGYNPYRYGIEDVIPEVARLAETTPLRYRDVLWICEEYGEGYRELIQKHIEARTIHDALDEMLLEIRTRIVMELLEEEKLAEEIGYPAINTDELVKSINQMVVKKKEDKLPRKLKAGWK